MEHASGEVNFKKRTDVARLTIKQILIENSRLGRTNEYSLS